MTQKKLVPETLNEAGKWTSAMAAAKADSERGSGAPIVWDEETEERYKDSPMFDPSQLRNKDNAAVGGRYVQDSGSMGLRFNPEEDEADNERAEEIKAELAAIEARRAEKRKRPGWGGKNKAK